MRPIDHKVDVSICQALACAQYRFPNVQKINPHSAELILGLRYGLIGIAAQAHVLEGCTQSEKENLLRQLKFFGTMIRENIEQDVIENPHHIISSHQAIVAKETYDELFARFVDLDRLRCPIDMILRILVEEFVMFKSSFPQWGIFSLFGRRTRRIFELESQKSLRFALGFLERRKWDLEELPEIALLDE